MVRHVPSRSSKQDLLTSVSRRMLVETLEPRVLLSGGLDPVQGAISVPGQVERYVFSLAQEKQILFDSQTNSSSLNWSLTGPHGAIVSNLRLSASDPVDNSSAAPFDLVAGSYTLSVQGAADATGTYQFRLLDLANAAPLIPGTPLSGTLNPGNETNLYQFSVNAGDKFYFDKQTLTGVTSSSEWRLLDPHEETVWATSLSNDIGTQSLTSSGTYTLLIEGGIANTGLINYSFNVQPVTNTTTALTLDGQISDTITQTGQQRNYTFNLATAGQLYFDSLTNDVNLNWTLTGPRGVEINARAFTNSDGVNFGSDPVLNLTAGSYTLTVAGVGDHTGSYSFRLSDLASAIPITPGAVISSALNPGNATKLYQFNTNAGDLIYFDEQSVSGGPTVHWRLIDQYGQQVWFTSFSDVGTAAMPSTGTYTLLVEGYIGNTSPVTYSFNVQPVTNPTAALTLGNQVNAAITQKIGRVHV